MVTCYTTLTSYMCVFVVHVRADVNACVFACVLALVCM